jgi:hypothetical protein
MISFDLRCDKGHVFEGWFASGARFDADRRAKRLECPLCGSRKVRKAPMAPNIGATKRAEAAPPAAPPAAPVPGMPSAETLRELRRLQHLIERNFDHVGERFAEEARKIHYGEVGKRSIYGSATTEESKALKDEGIEFGQIPWLPRHDA